MVLSMRSARIVCSLGTVMVLIATMASPGGARDDSPSQDLAGRRVEREKRFLFRAVEDLDKSLSYVTDMMDGLDRQIDGMQLLESARRENDLRGLLDWYYGYVSWLSEYRSEFEADINNAFSGEGAPKGWTERYSAMAKGYGQLAGDLQDNVNRLEYDKNEVEKRLVDLRSRMNYLNDLTNRDKDYRDLDKDRDRDSRDRPDKFSDEKDRERRTLEIARLVSEIQGFENLLRHLDVMTELGRYELNWVYRKTADCAVLNEAARAIERSGRASRDDLYDRVIRNYESDITFFRQKTDEIDRKRSRITRTGSLQTLDRLDDLSEYYNKMKRRYENHIDWLSQQIGAYRAESTGI
jgi:hypothetical protein